MNHLTIREQKEQTAGTVDVGHDFYRPVPPNNQAKCQFTGKGRSFYYRHILNGPARKEIRIVHLKRPGETRGGWLVHIGDLLAWLDRLAEEQAAEAVVN